MKTKLFAAALILVVLATNISAFAQADSLNVTTITSNEDSYIDSAKSTTNFGARFTMSIRGNAPTRRALLRFDLAAIPANAQIHSAILMLFVSSDGSPVAGSVNTVSGAWAENSVTYATAPQVGDLIAALPNPASPNSSVSVDLTAFITGKSLVDFYITSSNNDGVVYYTHEKSAAKSPQLIITWTTEAVLTPTETMPPSQTPTSSNPPTATETQTPPNTATATTPQQNPVLTFTPTADAYVQADRPTSSFGSSTQLVGDSSPVRNMLLKFTVSGIGMQTILSAKLRLHCIDPSPFGGEFHRVADTNWSEGSVNWNNAPAADIESIATLGKVTASTWYEINVTSFITGDGTFSFMALSTSTDGAYYSSKEGPAGFAPQLVITTAASTSTVPATSTSASALTSTATPTNLPSATLTATDMPMPSNTPTTTDTATPSVIPPFTPTLPLTMTSTPNPVLTFTPVADTYIQSDLSTSNFGSATQLVGDNSPVRHILLKFTVSGIGTRSILSAKLRLYCIDPSPFGGEFYRVADTIWGEGTVNWNNAPGADAGSFATLGKVISSTWYEVDVSSLMTGDGTFSFMALSTSTDGAYYSSKEGAAGFAPQLVITTSVSTPTPTVIAPNTSTPTATPTAMPSPTPTSMSTPIDSPTPPPAGTDPTIMAAGDIICNSLITSSSGCQQMAVSQVVIDRQPTAALILGDLCHTPSVDCFNNYFDPSWGRLFSIAHPTTGNHDYLVSGAIYYFDYWNGIGNAAGPAGDRSQGYYSFDIGAWHLIALNSQCSNAGGCSSGSPQYTWLQQDLQNHANLCTLAYYHIPVFSSGGRAASNMKQIYALLYDNNVDVVLDGHDHIYERFAPQDSNGLADPLRGIREFIVGTGGANHTSIAAIQPNSEVRNTDTFGALQLTLHPDRYDWRFMPIPGKTFTDSGTSLCH